MLLIIIDYLNMSDESGMMCVYFLLNSIFSPNLSVKNLWILRHTSIPWRQKMHKILIIGDLPTSRRNFRVKKKFKGVSFKMSSVFSPSIKKNQGISATVSWKCLVICQKNLNVIPIYLYLSYFWMKMHTATKYTKTLHVATSMYLTYSI